MGGEMEDVESVPKPIGRRVRKSRRAEETPRKCTILLSPKMDFKLSVYAKMKGTDRSVIINELLDREIGSMSVSFRNARGGEDGATA